MYTPATALECVKLVAPILAQVNPTDARLYGILTTVRQAAAGHARRADLQIACAQAEEIYQEVFYDYSAQIFHAAGTLQMVTKFLLTQQQQIGAAMIKAALGATAGQPTHQARLRAYLATADRGKLNSIGSITVD